MEKKFKEFLGESPQAIIDNWSGFSVKTTRITKRVINTFWEVIHSDKNNGKPYCIIKSKEKTNLYILGAWGHEGSKEVFVVITQLSTLPRKQLESFMKKPIQMSEVETMSGFKGQGYAKILYSWFLFNGYTVISDNTQYNGARKLYSSLSKNDNVRVDLFDDENKVFIKKDIDVDSGEEDWDFDSELWSINTDKSHLLICLSKI